MKNTTKFQVGDKVALLNDNLEGIISNIHKDEIVMVTSDGFDISCTSDEIVKTGNLVSLLNRTDDTEFLLEKSIEKRKNTIQQKSSRKNRIPPMEVDLHIQQLITTSKGLSNYDMLNIQMETAKHKLEFAIKNKIQRIVFIHGVGEGVLKTELEYLFKKYPVDFYEGDVLKYGQGATEVYIFQNENNS
jgi:hypothetical protein